MSDQDRASVESGRPLTVEFVRANPGMFIGDTGQRGLGQTLYRLIVNSLAEATAGHGRSVRVLLNLDGSVEIEDDGRLPPDADICPGCTVLDAAASPFNSPGGQGGRNWWDYAVANCLADRFVVEARHAGRVHRQEFRRGEPITLPAATGEAASPGLSVTFRPDPIIFDSVGLSAADTRHRLREYAFLHSGVRLTLADPASGRDERFEYADGMRACIDLLDQGHHPLHGDAIVVRGAQHGVRFEAALRWHREDGAELRAYTNGDFLPAGGTLVSGLWAAVTRSLNRFVRNHLSDARPLTGREAKAGSTAVVSAWLADPTYQGATRSRLLNPEARRAVESVVGQALRAYFRASPHVAERVVRAALARSACTPIRHVSVDPAWRTSTVISIAEGISAERAFDRLPILADALEDAGCIDPTVLDHCRDADRHVRGCWLLDRLLDRG